MQKQNTNVLEMFPESTLFPAFPVYLLVVSQFSTSLGTSLNRATAATVSQSWWQTKTLFTNSLVLGFLI